MSWQALGDCAWLHECVGNDPASRLASALAIADALRASPPPGATDVVSSYDSVAVHCQPEDLMETGAWLADFTPPADQRPAERRIIEIPTCYNGPDLDDASRALGLSPQALADRHAGTAFTVAALGFSPGFPYLAGLPSDLALPRKATPERVPAGSVAIAGNQAGIYPMDSQGGWHVLGRTHVRLFDPHGAQPTLMRPGDRVRFVASDHSETPVRVEIPACTGPIEVLKPGAFTAVQDAGRPGFQHLGVTPGGVLDTPAAAVANLLVGNPSAAALLECFITGPVLRFHAPCTVAHIGWDHPESGKPVAFEAGSTLDLSRPPHSRIGYIAVAGGIDAPALLHSRATDIRAHFGGHAGRGLVAGDSLPIGRPAHPIPRRGDWHVAYPHDSPRPRPIVLRFLRGPQWDWFTPDARHAFAASEFRINATSDRTGTRLDSRCPLVTADRAFVSRAVIAGTIQVPPSGNPIVLMAERQTLGGYPQIGHVITADLPLLVRQWPDTPVRFEEVPLAEALAAHHAQLLDLARLQVSLAGLC